MNWKIPLTSVSPPPFAAGTPVDHDITCSRPVLRDPHIAIALQEIIHMLVVDPEFAVRKHKTMTIGVPVPIRAAVPPSGDFPLVP